MSAQAAHTCGVCSASHRQDKAYSPAGSSAGTLTESMMLKENLRSQYSRWARVQFPPAPAPPRKQAALPYPNSPGSGGENCGAGQSGVPTPPEGPAHAGIGFFVQADPGGWVPVETRAAAMARREEASAPYWIQEVVAFA